MQLAAAINYTQNLSGEYHGSAESLFLSHYILFLQQIFFLHLIASLVSEKENERNSAAVHAKLVGGQTSSGIGLDRLEECMLGKEGRGGEMLSNEETFVQHLRG